MEMCDTEDAAPSADLRVRREEIQTGPEVNAINLRVIQPDNDDVVACVY